MTVMEYSTYANRNLNCDFGLNRFENNFFQKIVSGLLDASTVFHTTLVSNVALALVFIDCQYAFNCSHTHIYFVCLSIDKQVRVRTHTLYKRTARTFQIVFFSVLSTACIYSLSISLIFNIHCLVALKLSYFQSTRVCPAIRSMSIDQLVVKILIYTWLSAAALFGHKSFIHK